MWSPTEPDEGLRKEIDALGPVRHLVSPNKLHYVHVCAWKRAYPKPRRGPHRGRGSRPLPDARRSASIVTSRTSPRRRDAGTWNN